MYAIISYQGSQHKIEPGTVFDVNRIDAEPGDTITLDKNVLMASTDGDVKTGSPVLEGANVQLEVVEHFRGKKLTVFKMKRRKRYRRKKGHRQELTKVRVADISLA